MDRDYLELVRRLDLDATARSLWTAAASHLGAAARGEDAGLLAALAGTARSTALSGSVSVAALLDAYNEGCGQLCRTLEGDGGSESRDAGLHLRALDRVAMAHIATGYCAGLEETLQAMRRAVADVSPVDAETGALKPRELVSRLAQEAERCRRAEGPLGLVAFGLASPDAHSRALSQVAMRLGAGIRRYDSVGLTGEGDVVVIMPDVSRRGLAAAAGRLTREAERPSARGPCDEVVCTLAHYDVVDQAAPAMMATLERRLAEARQARARAAS
jgi:GGDEF domain-containing protein